MDYLQQVLNVTEAEESYIFFVMMGFLDDVYLPPGYLSLQPTQEQGRRATSFITEYLTDGVANVGWVDLI